MLDCGHRFGLALVASDGTLVGQAAIEPDWEPAHEWARFEGVRSGRLSPVAPGDRAQVEPLWDEAKGPPFARGFRVRVSADGEETAEDFGLEYLRDMAGAACAPFVKAGKLDAAETFYFVTAFEREAQPEREAGRFVVQPLVPPLVLRETPLAALATGAELVIPETPGDMPVFVPRPVLDETRELARAAGEKETGGVLVGHLHRDPASAELFGEVTAQIPAAHTVADVKSLTFTKESWSHVRGVMGLRNKDELMLGWWHSHVIYKLCSPGCGVEKRRACDLTKKLFSADDKLLHRTMFVRSYGLALVVSVVQPGEEHFSMFGWRKGLLQPRGFATLASSEEGK